MEPYKAVAKDRRSDSRVDGEKKLQLWLHAIACCHLLLLSSLLNKYPNFPPTQHALQPQTQDPPPKQRNNKGTQQ
jgi:hypothetical protein